MLPRIAFLLGWLRRVVASQADLLIENLALRRLWPRWKETLVIIQPETVVRWHRQGLGSTGPGSLVVEALDVPAPKPRPGHWSHRMTVENPTWGAPRIHGELLMLGFDVSGADDLPIHSKAPPDPEARQRWRNFLRNHREDLAAMDVFTVPTATFRMLYVFFVIHHARRTVLHVRVTEYPNAGWIIQQLREAFAYDAVPATSSSTTTRNMEPTSSP